MKKKIIIIGAGGLGRIVYDVLSQDSDVCSEYNLTGFLDTRADLELPPDLTTKILGSPFTYTPQPGDLFIPAIGDPQLRINLLKPLIAKNVNFYSYTNRASVAARAKIGKGVFLTPGAVISTDCHIGDFTYVDTYVILGHDVRIEENCMIGAMSFIAGGVHVESGTAIHPRSTIAKGVTLGENCTIGIGSVVIKNVPRQVTVFGNPARTIST